MTKLDFTKCPEGMPVNFIFLEKGREYIEDQKKMPAPDHIETNTITVKKYNSSRVTSQLLPHKLNSRTFDLIEDFTTHGLSEPQKTEQEKIKPSPRKSLLGEDGYFKLYACCIPVKGVRRSVIHDLQQEKFYFIPNQMISMINDLEAKNISTYLKDNEAFAEHISEYINFLIDNRLGFICKAALKNNFPKVNLEWKIPAKIWGAVIDQDNAYHHDYEKIAQELDELGCRSVELRFFRPVDVEFLHKTLSYFKDKVIESIEITLKYAQGISNEKWKEMCVAYPRIRTIYIYSSPYSKLVVNRDNHMGNILYLKESASQKPTSTIANPKLFIVNNRFFMEAIEHNVYYNRKVFIDTNGEAKNCNNHTESFGNINTQSLSEIIQNQEFQKLWFAKKSNTRICRDCEFRNMCSDPRLPVWDEDKKEFFHHEKCNYDPYTASFKEENDNH